MNAFESSHQSLKTNEKICQQINKSDKKWLQILIMKALSSLCLKNTHKDKKHF